MSRATEPWLSFRCVALLCILIAIRRLRAAKLSDFGTLYICYLYSMAYRKFQADHLFTGTEILDGNNVLITDENGIIKTIIPADEAGDDIQQFNGLLSPGFINCHCHLELSHMKGLIPEKTGLIDFVFKVVTERHFSEDEILDAIAKAEEEMLSNGIVAVGDICNNTLTLSQKLKQRLAYYNLIEVSGWLPQIAGTRFERSKNFYDSFSQLTTHNYKLPSFHTLLIPFPKNYGNTCNPIL